MSRSAALQRYATNADPFGSSFLLTPESSGAVHSECSRLIPETGIVSTAVPVPPHLLNDPSQGDYRVATATCHIFLPELPHPEAPREQEYSTVAAIRSLFDC